MLKALTQNLLLAIGILALVITSYIYITSSDQSHKIVKSRDTATSPVDSAIQQQEDTSEINVDKLPPEIREQVNELTRLNEVIAELKNNDAELDARIEQANQLLVKYKEEGIEIKVVPQTEPPTMDELKAKLEQLQKKIDQAKSSEN